MARDLFIRPLSDFPFGLSRFLDTDSDDIAGFGMGRHDTGLTVSEDDNHIYIEAAVPGVDPDKVEVTYDKGVVWVRARAEQEEKDKNRKYYRRSARAYSYRVAVPENADTNSEPQATYKNGVMRITFNKIQESEPKKLTVTKE